MNQQDIDRINKTIENATSGLGRILDDVGSAISGVADAVNDFSKGLKTPESSGSGAAEETSSGAASRSGGASGFAENAAKYADRAREVYRREVDRLKEAETGRAGRWQSGVVHQGGNTPAARGAENSGKQVPKTLFRSPAAVAAKGIGKTAVGYTLAAAGALVLGGAVIGSFIPLMVGGGLLIAAGLPVGVSGSVDLSRGKRFRLYVQALGNKTLLNLRELAESTGRSVKFLRKDLKDMSARKLFTEPYFDDEEEIFMVSEETYRDYRNLLETRKKAAEAERAADRELYEAGLSDAGVEIVKQGRAYLEKIQKINAELPEPEITEKLLRLESVVGSILREVRKKPASATELRRLMNYYLPTTWKLLTTYQEIEKEPVKTGQMRETQAEIEKTLDTINAAFEKLLNQLFQSKAWDVSADISVLNTMLSTEGLTDEGISSMVKEKETWQKK